IVIDLNVGAAFHHSGRVPGAAVHARLGYGCQQGAVEIESNGTIPLAIAHGISTTSTAILPISGRGVMGEEANVVGAAAGIEIEGGIKVWPQRSGVLHPTILAAAVVHSHAGTVDPGSIAVQAA